MGWYDKTSEGRTHRVGEKPANPWHLYDLHGNVWEWTLSAWEADAYKKRRYGIEIDPGTVEPTAASRGGERVIRGGSFTNAADWTRSAFRFWWHPGVVFRSHGFRVLLPRP